MQRRMADLSSVLLLGHGQSDGLWVSLNTHLPLYQHRRSRQTPTNKIKHLQEQ